MSTRPASEVEDLLATPDLGIALDSDRFKNFLDHIPVAIAVSELGSDETIVYVNHEFAELTGRSEDALVGKGWSAFPGQTARSCDDETLAHAICNGSDYLGNFVLDDGAGPSTSLEAWANEIAGEDGEPKFRVVALADGSARADDSRRDLEQLIADKDTLLNELQHRVKNNLQMITALIRLEARALPDHAVGTSFTRLAGRIEALALLYRALGDVKNDESVDLGSYLSQIATAVMQAHAVEGIRLDLKADSWPVSVNVAMPAGLVVNELLTNALKHAFVGREGGTISLSCLVDDGGCRVIVKDDGVGMPPGTSWPKAGRLGAAIAQSLRQNAKADIDTVSKLGSGTRVTISFARTDAEPGS